MRPPPIETGGRAVNPAVAELAGFDRWVVWKIVRRRTKDGQIKETKPPYCIGGRRKAKSTDSDDLGLLRPMLDISVRRPCCPGNRLRPW